MDWLGGDYRQCEACGDHRVDGDACDGCGAERCRECGLTSLSTARVLGEPLCDECAAATHAFPRLVAWLDGGEPLPRPARVPSDLLRDVTRTVRPTPPPDRDLAWADSMAEQLSERTATLFGAGWLEEG